MGEVIKFPIKNPRVELGILEVEQRSLEDTIQAMKMAHFAALSDSIVEDVIRSISVLGLDESQTGAKSILDSKDVIMLKETIVATMCRIVGIEHPLHAIENQELILAEYIEDVEGYDVPYFRYRFKSEPEEASRID